MKATLFAVLAGLCWGVGEVCTKSALQSGRVGPITALCVRIVLAVPPAAVAYLIVHAWLKTEPAQWWRLPTPDLLKLVLGSSLLAGFGGVLFFYLGLGSTGGDISKVKPIAFSLAPATGVLLGWWLLGEAMTPRKAVGVALILAGVVLVTTKSAVVPSPEPPITTTR